MSAALINTKVDEAIAAHEAGDTATSLAKLRSAKMLLSGIPDGKHEDQELKWDRNAIDSMIGDLKRQQGAKAGIRCAPIRYVNPTR